MTWLATLAPVAPFALPVILLIWTLSPLCIRQGDEAKKTPLFATWPARSSWGNNPASQRRHEGGGYRLGALLTVALQVAIGAIAVASDAGNDGLIGAALAQFAAVPLFFVATRRVIDLAEHGAEIIHADSHPIDPDAARWMRKRGFMTYRAAEAWRMTQRHQEYEAMTPNQFLIAIDRWRWLSRIIVKLGAW